ncbi:MAG: sugar phosphate isomerase/epimerase [Clostridia bacterium]|nr:sugar phosphate isomerase/epimerase [Clostridia bacterium]
MILGVFTVCMPEYDISETVKVIKELGYDGVEWRVSTPAPQDKREDYTYETRYWCYNKSTLDIGSIEAEAEKAKALCDEYGIKLYSLTTYLKPCDVQDIEKVLKAAAKINCPNIRVFSPNYDEKEGYRVLFDRTVEETKVLEKLAQKYGVRINFEIHMGNIIPSASAAYRFASHFDPKHIGIIFDPGNMVHEGFENYRLGLELLGDYLAYVHVKNAVWSMEYSSEEGAEKWKPKWSPLKKGYADLKKLFEVLKDLGYNGYVSLEDFTNEVDTYSKLKNNAEYLRALT